MRAGIDSIMLNVNNTTSAFYTSIAVLKWMRLNWQSNNPIVNVPSPMPPTSNFQKLFLKKTEAQAEDLFFRF
jgi:hypothetical protein